MTEFEKEVTNISESFFGDGSIEIDGASLKYIIDSGAYGTFEHAIGGQLRKDGKFVSALKMMFPPLKEMQIRYSVLNKVPILLPIFYVVRWFSIMSITSPYGHCVKRNSCGIVAFVRKMPYGNARGIALYVNITVRVTLCHWTRL